MHAILNEHPFLAAVRASFAALGRNPEAFTLDHACWRSATHAGYTAAKRALLASGAHSFLHESLVRGRPIALFERRVPCAAEGWECFLIEVCAPKPEGDSRDGWEHVEVLPRAPAGDTAGSAGRSEVLVPTRAGLVKIAPRALREVVEEESAGRERIFTVDLDGTLIESRAQLRAQVAQCVVQFNGAPPADEALERALASVTFPCLFAALGFAWDEHHAAIFAALEATSHVALETSRPLAHSAAHLESLAKRHALILWTARDRATALVLLRHHGLIRYFDGLCAADDGACPQIAKPDPVGVRLLAGTRSVAGHWGDSNVDAMGAQALGVPFFDARDALSIHSESSSDRANRAR